MAGQREQPASQIPLAAIQSFIDSLDEAFLLDNSRFVQGQTESWSNSFKRSVRTVTHLHWPGRAIRKTPLPAVNLSGHSCLTRRQTVIRSCRKAWLIKTYRRAGGPAYRVTGGRQSVFSRLTAPCGDSPYDRVIVLGVGHNMTRGLFSVTGKDFVTPAGHCPGRPGGCQAPAPDRRGHWPRTR